ncbi:MAG: hypothetical protein ACRBFS_09670 [Aureispira sp.]
MKDQEELLRLVKEAYDMFTQNPHKILALTNVSNTVVGPEFMSEIKRLGVLHQDKFEKTAVIGITGLKKVLLKGYNMFMPSTHTAVPFETKEEALDYLVA